MINKNLALPEFFELLSSFAQPCLMMLSKTEFRIKWAKML